MIVVSPHVALMEDQVRQTTVRGVTAMYIGEVDDTTDGNFCSGQYQLVHLSPEAC